MIREAFLGFVEVHAKDLASLENAILGCLKSDNTSLINCRSQCYDIAAMMTGHIFRLQQQINAKNLKALLDNGDSHSLNLAGTHSAKQDSFVLTLLGPLKVFIHLILVGHFVGIH